MYKIYVERTGGSWISVDQEPYCSGHMDALEEYLYYMDGLEWAGRYKVTHELDGEKIFSVERRISIVQEQT